MTNRIPLEERIKFLENDLADALKGLFVGAVIWKAADTSEICPFQKGIGMFASFLQARALYEFYHSKGSGKDDDARAKDFAPAWDVAQQSDLYKQYMAPGRPANKRLFHLVYFRSEHSGGPIGEHDGPEHLKNRVLDFAKDLIRLTEDFINSVEPQFHESAERALQTGRTGGNEAAKACGIANPL
jgi:hypothetical protein